MKIIKILEFHTRIKQIITILEFHMKIIFRIIFKNNENLENLEIIFGKSLNSLSYYTSMQELRKL